MELYAQIDKELYDFFHNKVHIAGKGSSESVRYLKNDTKDYNFSQWETLQLIDLYYNSKFETGQIDSEGQRKLFLNICKFRSDVASKQIDLDVKNFNFLPEEGESEWGAFLISKEFKYWAKENYLGELLNTCVENFPKYGWVVMKRVKGKLEHVPLQTLRNQQDAKSLAKAKYVIIEHKDMSVSDMEEMKGWDIKGLDMKFGETETVYERYGSVSEKDFNIYKGIEGGDEDREIDCLTICTLKKENETVSGHVLFMEQITERPFVECFWSKQHGRLMGVGEIENQFENQIGANMSFNLYRRQLLWSSKKIFQSPDDSIAKNLIRDVKDGDVLQIGTNGNITPVDMSNRAGADFASFQTILEKNSDQKGFTYESATGAALPSGTPFRLGVLMTNAVNSHFDLKREKLGLCFKQAIMQLVMKDFKKEFDEQHIVSMFADEEGYEALKQIAINLNTNDEIKKQMFAGQNPDPVVIKQKVTEQLDTARFLFVNIPDSFYKDINYKVTLDITGEEVDVPKQIETLTNVYTGMVQRGDPRADRVLSKILALTGQHFDLLAGPKPPPQPQQAATPSPVQPSTLNQPSTPNIQV